MPVDRHAPPYKAAGALLLVFAAVATSLLYLQFRGELATTTRLTVLSPRAGLVVDPGSKVTYNGVEIGKVAAVDYLDVDGAVRAKLTLSVDPRYLALIPRNVVADIRATTVFGNKYVSLRSPESPDVQRITSNDVIDASSVTTEFNTLFENALRLAEQVDPVKLNTTLTTTAQALTGLGQKFGDSLIDGNQIMADLIPRMPQLRADTRVVADLSDVYANAADLWDGLDNAATTARTLDDQSASIDAALMATIGFGETADSFERGGPYFVRAAEDLLPTTQLLDDYRAMIFCTVRNYDEVRPRLSKVLGGDNGYALKSYGTILLPGNPFIYPDNLPRVNARGGPEGRPGCWQKVTKDLWPFPYLVMDTGYSIAPYNHFELASPLVSDYIWGRQVGENTINP
ncbi:MCE family protein [Mycobacterium sp. 1274761.0]|uniref:MCE family protein n=1 Tax=Mycobacterium sp. 1274761.0 TaxID=1834077 RepID=UPI0007FE08A9|nr:MCE family protein [Mycobacterium sp. 1274761.0]OBK74516.1 MCE-family protein MCE1A [Mycobacterium sp. 1274761.0]